VPQEEISDSKPTLPSDSRGDQQLQLLFVQRSMGSSKTSPGFFAKEPL
jgi:hypothetical protein